MIANHRRTEPHKRLELERLSADRADAPLRGDSESAVDFAQRETRYEDDDLLLRTAIALDAGQMATFDWNLTTDVAIVNDRFREMVGWPTDAEVTGAAVLERIHPDDRDRVDTALQRSVDSDEDYDTQFRIVRPDGSICWLGARGRAVKRDPQGTALRMMGINYDLTEQKAEEERLELLARELNHRVQNIFSVILSIVTLTGRGESDAGVAMEKVRSRVHALARAHEVSQGRLQNERVDLADVVEAVLAPYRTTPTALLLDGPPLPLDLDSVAPLGMVVHELATNAAKYGAWAGVDGSVELGWRICDDPNYVRLTWHEVNGAAVCAASERQGFGTRMIDQTVRQLSGTIERTWTATGLHAEIVIRRRVAT